MSDPALQRAVRLLGLSDAEVAALAHVSPAALDDVARRLSVWIDPAHLRHFVHQPRSEFAGRPLLQALAEDGPEAVHAAVDRLLASGLLPGP